MDAFERLIEHDVQALDLYQEALKRPAHRLESTRDEPSYEQPHHTSTAGVLRRLKKDRLDLHARVLAGEITPYAAAKEAGFRASEIRVPLGDMSRLAEKLRNLLDKEQLRELIERLK